MGGNPKEGSKELAHKGIKPASDPESKVYYKNIPFTCGACHQKQLQNFETSVHFKNLEGNSLAPDCRTCHGSMGIIKVEPIKISEKCQLCHNPQVGAPLYIPEKAKKLFLLQEQIKGEIRRAQEAVDKAKHAGKDVTEAETSIAESQKIMGKSAEVWHKFDLKNFEDELYDALYYAYKADNEVGSLLSEEVPAKAPKRGICGPTIIVLIALIPFIRFRK
jgi:hypothetical protein